MKYWKITRGATDPDFIRYEKANTLEELKTLDNMYAFGSNFFFEEVQKSEYDKYFADEAIKQKADKGQLIDDIAIWHNVFSETLIKIIIFKYSTEVAMRVKMKVISDIIAKYNLDLVIKDFKPDYTLPQEDKTKLVDGLKEIEAYDDGIYNRMAQAVGLEAGALHNAVVDAYESSIQTLHQTQPQQFTGNTLAGELANSHTGAK